MTLRVAGVCHNDSRCRFATHDGSRRFERAALVTILMRIQVFATTSTSPLFSMRAVLYGREILRIEPTESHRVSSGYLQHVVSVDRLRSARRPRADDSFRFPSNVTVDSRSGDWPVGCDRRTPVRTLPMPPQARAHFHLLAKPTGAVCLFACHGYKAFFTHIDRPMRLMADLLRQGRYADEAMAMLSRAG